jgi:hypothetical protein
MADEQKKSVKPNTTARPERFRLSTDGQYPHRKEGVSVDNDFVPLAALGYFFSESEG